MSEFEQFFRQEYDPVLRALTVAFGDRHRAEDAAQEGLGRSHARWSRVSLMDRQILAVADGLP